jgi:RND family efflux transporter MFP subunit
MFKGSAAKLALRRIDELFHSGIAGDLSDSELLDRFLRCVDSGRESAFAALVERHGPMVFRVCQQALKDHHDAQDAVQATFFVLARRAGAIRKRTSVSSWLFGVARRAAGHIRMEQARRRRSESRAVERASALIATQKPPDDDPYPELHAEIERLPEKYRVPIVLCYLEGLTHEQAASRLRWPLGTVKIRLSRARERLRVRLEKQGRPYLFVLPASPVGPGVPEHFVETITRGACQYASNGAGRWLASSTVPKVTEAVMKSMLIKKLVWAGVAASGLFLLGFGAIVAAQQATGRRVAAGQVLTLPGRAKPDDSRSMLQVHGATDFVPDRVLQVRAPVDCRVDHVLVDFGTRVKKGDPLLEVFSSDLAEAKNSYLVAVSQWEHDKRMLELHTAIVKEGRLSREELIRTQSTETQSRLKMSLARDKLLVFGLTVDEIEKTREEDGVHKGKMVLRSRASGTVVLRNAVPGNYYASTDNLMTIARLDALWVRARVNEVDAEKVKVGQNVIVQFPFGDRQIRAKLEAIAAQVDHESHTVLIRTTIPNPDGRLKPGAFVRMAVETDARDEEMGEGRGAVPGSIEATMRTNLNELERKLDRLLDEKEERSSHAKILERLEALERKLDQVLNGPRS